MIFLGRHDCNKLMAAATPIFTNVLPPGYQDRKEKQGEEEKQEPSGTGEESTLQGAHEVAKQAPHPEHLVQGVAHVCDRHVSAVLECEIDSSGNEVLRAALEQLETAREGTAQLEAALHETAHLTMLSQTPVAHLAVQTEERDARNNKLAPNCFQSAIETPCMPEVVALFPLMLQR